MHSSGHSIFAYQMRSRKGEEDGDKLLSCESMKCRLSKMFKLDPWPFGIFTIFTSTVIYEMCFSNLLFLFSKTVRFLWLCYKAIDFCKIFIESILFIRFFYRHISAPRAKRKWSIKQSHWSIALVISWCKSQRTSIKYV